MKKHGCLLIILMGALLAGCVDTVWTGATLVYDRHSVYSSLNDCKLAMKGGHSLSRDKSFTPPASVLDLAVFHGDILLAGRVPTEELRQLATDRVKDLSGYRAIYNQIEVTDDQTSSFADSWITTKIRSRIFADSSIAPKDFKIVTVNGLVYLMGDVGEAQAERVVAIARDTDRVRRVVSLLHVLVPKKLAIPSSAPSEPEALSG
jgi:osmotically-inducible protein OsmY